MTERRPVFNILPVGWDHPAWVGEFYPKDLPPEWRLTYFANEFSGVLVPQSCWFGLDCQTLSSWGDDVAECFYFYFLINQLVDRQILVDVQACLGARFGGFVVQGPYSELTAEQGCKQGLGLNCYTLLSAGFTADDIRSLPGHEQRIAVNLSETDLADLRGQRRFMERLADQLAPGAEALLFLDGDPPVIDQLRALRTLAQLLGLA